MSELLNIGQSIITNGSLKYYQLIISTLKVIRQINCWQCKSFTLDSSSNLI